MSENKPVQRYECDRWDGLDMNDNGDLVLFTDYKKLKSENEQLKHIHGDYRIREKLAEADIKILKIEQAKLTSAVDELIETLEISANKHLGIALCFGQHGTNLNIPFLMADCLKDDERARTTLAEVKKRLGRE